MPRKRKYTQEEIVALCDAYVKDQEHFTGFGARNVEVYYRDIKPLPIPLTYLDIRRCKEAVDYLDGLKGKLTVSFEGNRREINVVKDVAIDIDALMKSGNHANIRKTLCNLKKSCDEHRQNEINLAKELGTMKGKYNAEMIKNDSQKRVIDKLNVELEHNKDEIADKNRQIRELVATNNKILRYLNQYVYPGLMQAVFAEQGFGDMKTEIPAELAELLNPTGMAHAVTTYTNGVKNGDDINAIVMMNDTETTVAESQVTNEETVQSGTTDSPFYNFTDKLNKL